MEAGLMILVGKAQEFVLENAMFSVQKQYKTLIFSILRQSEDPGMSDGNFVEGTPQPSFWRSLKNQLF